MKKNFIFHIKWKKSENILYFTFIISYFFIVVPILIILEFLNPELVWTDYLNIAAFIFNSAMFIRNTKIMQSKWEEFYLPEVEATKNVILKKTCDTCINSIHLDADKLFQLNLTYRPEIKRGKCRVLYGFKLRKKDCPTCRKWTKIPYSMKEII